MSRRVKDDMDFFLIQIKGLTECSRSVIIAEDFEFPPEIYKANSTLVSPISTGTRRYLMQEDDTSLAKIRRRIQKMLIVDRTFRILLAAFILYKILMKLNLMGFADFMGESRYASETFAARI